MRVHFADGEYSLLEKGMPLGVDFSVGGKIPNDTEVLVSGFIEKRDIEGLDQLQALVIPWAGLPNSTRNALRERPEVAVYNLHHNAASTAETAISLMLACSREIVPHDRLMREGNWAPRWSSSTSVRLAGEQMVVLGYGAIGKRVAAAGLGLGMDVSAVKLNGPFGLQGGVWVYSVDALAQVLDEARVLICAVPMTEKTVGLIGKKELSMLDSKAIVVNIGRGPVIDEEALFEFCRERKIHGAGLDVWWKYPKEGESGWPGELPWHELENVVMSPHVGGGHQENEKERMEGIHRLLSDLLKGNSSLTRVDVVRGY